MNGIEIIGTIASLITLLSFLMNNEKRIRIVNIVGCIVFVYYGIRIHAFSVWFLNAALIGIHVVKLIKLNLKEKNDNSKKKRRN